MYTFAFQGFVPPQMFIDNNSVQKEYTNRLSGSYGDIVLPTNDGGGWRKQFAED